jgi:hypothetical protein
VLDDAVLDSLTPERFARVLRAKAESALVLDEATRGSELDAFVLFSSVAGAFGSPVQGNYAAANAVLDAIAERRRADGLPATAISWGPWGEAGMAADDTIARRLRENGFTPLPTEPAVVAMRRALGQKAPTLLVADIGWEAFLRRHGDGRPGPLFAELPEARALSQGAAQDEPAQEAGRFATMNPAERQRYVLERVRRYSAQALGRTALDPADLDRGFLDLGFTSLTAVELRNRLGSTLELKLPMTVVFDYPTPRKLAEWLAGELAPAEDDDESGIRRAIADIPLDRLRRAGLLDGLLELARGADRADRTDPAAAQGPDAEGDIADGIDDLDVADLIRMTRENGDL